MTKELLWLTLTVILTGLLWVPYILDRIMVRGLMGAMANPSNLVLFLATSFGWSSWWNVAQRPPVAEALSQALRDDSFVERTVYFGVVRHTTKLMVRCTHVKAGGAGQRCGVDLGQTGPRGAETRVHPRGNRRGRDRHRRCRGL